MRFKKLRISIGIALIIFVLVVGNILAFGLAQHKQQQSVTKLSQSDLQAADSAPKKVILPAANQTSSKAQYSTVSTET